ncbi:MAG TPA: type II toxin-antitoxin system VapC family toxin [Solirubrobacterales bacterium]|nr:type II toxin-antitoxin system VapC family toxin [Solirubrobacterales bacterium]
MMQVVDASVLVELLTGGELGEASRRQIGARPGWLWAPYLVDAEVGHALRATVRAGEISARKGREVLGDMFEMQLQRVPHHLLVDRAWALRQNLSFYDGLYVALAEALDAPLLTLDSRLAKAPGVRAEIELIAPV